MKPQDIWLEFYIGNYLVKEKKAVKQYEFCEVALHKPFDIDSRNLERLRRKLHEDLDRIIDHAKQRQKTKGN